MDTVRFHKETGVLARLIRAGLPHFPDPDFLRVWASTFTKSNVTQQMSPIWSYPDGVALNLRVKCTRPISFRQLPLADQDIVLTVPASFDEEARELTGMAAVEAGLPSLTLLEEPAACAGIRAIVGPERA